MTILGSLILQETAIGLELSNSILQDFTKNEVLLGKIVEDYSKEDQPLDLGNLKFRNLQASRYPDRGNGEGFNGLGPSS